MDKYKQGDIIYLNFDPSDGHEIKKRRPALVMSRDEYNLSSNLVIVCPITITSKKAPYLIELVQPVKQGLLRTNSKVNIAQIYSLDVGKDSHRQPQRIGKLNNLEFLYVAQIMLQNFNFPF